MPVVRCLWPQDRLEIDDVDAFVAAEARPRREDQPWLVVNTVTSLDGGTAVDGTSEGLQAPADLAVFGALRAVADVVLAGAGTVRAEHYKPARPSQRRRQARRERGQPEVPPIAVVTASLDLDPKAPLFAEAEVPTIVLTCERGDPDRRRALDDVADVALCGVDRVEPHLALAALGDRGAEVVVCEGGPRLNGDLVAADVIDEWCLTLSPQLVGGDSRRAATGIDPRDQRALHLDRILEEEGMLLLRYVR